MSRSELGGGTPSRLAQASERLSALAYELSTVVQARREHEDSHAAVASPDPLESALGSVSSRLAAQALELAELAFVVAEDSVAASEDPRAERSAAALGRATRVVEPVFEMAGELAAHLLTCYWSTRLGDRPFDSGALAVLDGPIHRILAQDDGPLATGAGVAAAPGVLADEHLWLQWWVRDGRGLRQLRPQVSPDKPDLYDYTRSVWFSEAAREGLPHLAPPHFDDGGTDQVMVTAAVPVVADGLMLGVACAEVTRERIEQLIGPALAALPAPAAFVTPENLVVASTHAELRPGQPVPDELLGGSDISRAGTFTEPVPGVTLARSPAVAWCLVADWR